MLLHVFTWLELLTKATGSHGTCPLKAQHIRSPVKSVTYLYQQGNRLKFTKLNTAAHTNIYNLGKELLTEFELNPSFSQIDQTNI